MIREAQSTDHAILTKIAFASKKYWKYPEEYYDIWKEELTITEAYINKNIVYTFQESNNITGFYSLTENKKDQYFGKVFVEKGWWLDHLFILPEHIKKGIGTKLIHHMNAVCKQNEITTLKIFSDPNSNGFYQKIGARFIRESTSTIKGRTIPVYELVIQ